MIFSNLKSQHIAHTKNSNPYSGLAVTLRYPYSVNSDEPEFYEKTEGHAVLNKNLTGTTEKTIAESVSFRDHFFQLFKEIKMKCLVFFATTELCSDKLEGRIKFLDMVIFGFKKISSSLALTSAQSSHQPHLVLK